MLAKIVIIIAMMASQSIGAVTPADQETSTTTAADETVVVEEIEVQETSEEIIIEETEPVEQVEVIEETTTTTTDYVWEGETWNTYKGLNMNGPSGPETGYNLPMEGVVGLMRSAGYTEEEYPYWIRDDGMKMFGPYVMVGAYLPLRPKGTILPTSRGMGIVVDTGYFAYGPTQLDLAYAW